ncbi:acetyltransferase [Lentimicrobium saccharophilum]|uniref:Acetyltransferase n=1 Tax=Lentimicrobium saccharophilum TaxID=1678841 RepID=A0A0S7BZS4_9BACT|nr:acyltransferase [Lentimicrobium saccharophilum]GAP42352.1 acetyltransferase [Lentimicrobium saccharophilum]
MKKLIKNAILRLKHRNCKIHYTAKVSLKAVIESDCSIGADAVIASNVKLGKGVKIGSRVQLKNISIGNNSMIESGVMVVGPGAGKIVIGKECYIGINNIFDTSDSISIGDYVHIAGPSTALWCHTSVKMCLESIPLNDEHRKNYRPTAPIVIGDNVYIGCNCTLYPGIVINTKSVVAPNSAVTRNIEANTMVGGVPARIIRALNE